MSGNTINSNGSTYTNGIAASKDLRQLICDDMASSGAPQGLATPNDLHKIAQIVADRFKVDKKTVIKYWQQ